MENIFISICIFMEHAAWKIMHSMVTKAIAGKLVHRENLL